MDINTVEKVVLNKIKEFIEDNDIDVNEVNSNTRLIGSTGIFDSMDLVRFVIELEEEIEDHFSLEVSLTNEKAMSRSTSPFINSLTLAKFIKNLTIMSKTILITGNRRNRFTSHEILPRKGFQCNWV